MTQKITGDIDSTYRAQAQSLETLKHWHSQHPSVHKILISSHVIFPFIVAIFISLYFYYLIELEPNKYGEKLDRQIKAESTEINREPKATIWVIFTVSLLFNLYTIVVDSAAWPFYDIKSNKNGTSVFSSHSHAVPITMMLLDIGTFVVYIGVPMFVACCKYIRDRCTCCTGYAKIYKTSDILYTLIAPIVCIATHSYHIVFAFINNPYHATSVLFIYMMTLIILLIILHKIYYLLSENITNTCCQILMVVVCYVLAILVLTAAIGLTIAVLLILPIIDEASNQIYSIFQASITVFAALVTWKIFSGDTNSVFAVLIKSEDKRVNDSTDNEQNDSTKWKDMSDKEKEIELGLKIMKYINTNNKKLENLASPND